MKKRIVAIIMAIVTSATMLIACSDVDEVESARSKTESHKEETRENSDVKHIAKKYKSKANKGNDLYGKTNGIAYADVCEEASVATEEFYYDYEPEIEVLPPFNTEDYAAINENGFARVSSSPLSTFSADVDTASYSNIRRFINEGYSVDNMPDGACRTEEMINYFSYDYDGPKKGEPFGVNAEISTCPWNDEHKLLMMGLQTEAIDFSEAPDSNIVFLIDVSGSMYDDNKLPLLKKSFELMVDNLTEKDKVSIVTYASSDDVIIEGVPASNKEKIVEALESLEAGGSTNGANGIVSAYELAEEYYIKNGNNRVIIATDGDFNVGLTSESDLKELISKEKQQGIYLSVLGFGMGNYSDSRMETLADAGNGNYAYIDNLSEAKKVLVEELGATMVTVAKDVKLQVEFNPEYVAEYRLLGYEDRLLATEDFEDDSKDAGEIGAGHSVTVLYEIVPADEVETSDLKYQETKVKSNAKKSGEWLTLSVRYKEPNKDSSKLLEYPIGKANIKTKASDDFKFAAAVAEFSEIIRDSEYCDASLQDVLKLLKEIDIDDDEYKTEFYDLVYVLKNRSK